ncbi:MAG: PASTA domain-containing protein [Candidatus Hydrogenedentes bacterium]|nr:PASTA domain-containing protein [Candidatus Hydrogenedentota bacterium]
MRIDNRWKPEPAKKLDFIPTEEHRSRIWWVKLFFFLGSVVIFLRLGYIHLTPGAQLSDEDKFHIGRMIIERPRGEIFDRNGLVLATSINVPSVYVDPRRVSDPLALANYVSVHLNLPEDDVLKRLARTDASGKTRKMNTLKRWVRDLPKEELAALIDYGEGAIIVQDESLRCYPHGDSAAHLLGFVNRAGEASEGLELAFDKHLYSKSGLLRARKDRNRELLPSGLLSYEEPEGGEMVQLTLDINMQHALEDAIDRRMEEVGAVLGHGILMNPHTGAIFALASRPAFDPNCYDEFPAERRKNRALLDVFEPGSVMKIVTAAAVLEHGLATMNTLIDCENGSFNPYGHRIRDFHKLGIIPFWKAFEQSSNIALIKLAALLGPERLETWIRLFGFGECTSPDFQFESRGIFRARKDWSRLSMGSLPMGQEIAVTMPQLAKAMAVIANGGYVVQPYFVEQVVSQQGEKTYEYRPPKSHRILSTATAETMQELCHQVVLKGTGRAASIQEYRTCGKTGTAQMARKNGRGYDPDRYTTVFAGFAPLSDPKIVSVIVIQEPTIRLRYGGYVCGPVFKEVVRDALIRLGVPEDPVGIPNLKHTEDVFLAQKHRAVTAVKVPEARVPEKEEIEEPESGMDADIIAPPPAPEDLDDDIFALLTSLDGLDLVARRMVEDGKERAMPDLIGMTKRQALDQLKGLEIPMDAQGAGWVIAQDPPAGAALQDVVLCALYFGNKTVTIDDNEG